MATRDEILRFVIKTEGGQEVANLAKEVTGLGDASGEAEKQANALLDEFANTARLKQSVTQLREVGAAVLQYQRDLQASTATITSLAQKERELIAVENDRTAALARAKAELKAFTDGSRAFFGTTQQIAAAQKEARADVQRLTAEYRESATARKAVTAELERERAGIEKTAAARNRELATSKELRAQLERAGVSATRLGAAERELAARTTQVADSLRGMSAALRAARTEEERLAAAKQAQIAAESRIAQARARSALALEEYRRNAQQATAATNQLTSAGERSTGVFSRLRGVAAGALAAFSITGLANGIRSILELGDSTERAQKQLSRLFGGVEEGKQAFASLNRFADDNSLALQNVLAAAVKFKTFGIDPLNGSLQALVDQNAAVGGSQDDLLGKILALGQAWTKQKLQGEEVLQLAERGIPVWDLLAAATGKSVAQLQKLSEAGKLGRKEIGQLIEQIGKLNAGATAESANLLSSLFTRLAGKVREFFVEVNQSGALDSFKQRLRGIIDQIDELTKSGQLLQYAKSLSNALSSIAGALFNTTKFVIEHATAITNLAMAYAAFKVGSFVLQIGQAAAALLGFQAAATAANAAAAASATSTGIMATAAAAASNAMSLLGRALGLVRANPAIAATAVALGAIIPKVVELIEVNERLADTEAEAARQRLLNIAKIEFLKQAGKDYANTLVLQTSEINRLTTLEAASYSQRLARAEGYYRALASEARIAGDAAGLKGANENLALIAPALAAVRKHVEDVEAAATKSSSRFGLFATAAGDAFDLARSKGESVRDEIQKIFKEINLTDPKGIKNLGEAFVLVGSRGREASRILREELRKQLVELSDGDLQKFRRQVDVAFKAGVDGAGLLKSALSNINAARLGVDLEAIRKGYTDVGASAVRAFRGAVVEIKNAGLTAQQQSIATAQAFDAAFKSAATSKELEGLKKALQQAFNAGEISADKYAERAKQVNEEIAKLAPASNLYKPPTQELQNLGTVANQVGQELQQTGQYAKEAADKTSDFATRGGAFLQNVAEAIKQTRAEFEAISESAAREFDRLVLDMERVRTSVGAGAGFDTVARNLRIAADETRKAVDGQRASLEEMIASLNAYGTGAADTFHGAARDASQVGAQLAILDQQIKDGTTSFTLLGQQELQPLQQALEAARSKTAELENQARSATEALRDINDSLQDQIDQQRGDSESVENRRFQRQLEQIREQAELAGELGRQEAAAAEARAEQLHQQNLRRLRDEAAEKRNQESQRDNGGSGSSSSQSSGGSAGGGSQLPAIQNVYVLWDEASKERAARDWKKRIDHLAGLGG